MKKRLGLSEGLKRGRERWTDEVIFQKIDGDPPFVAGGLMGGTGRRGNELGNRGEGRASRWMLDADLEVQLDRLPRPLFFFFFSLFTYFHFLPT